MTKINYFIIPGLPTYFMVTEDDIFDAIKEHLNITKEQVIEKKKPSKVVDARKILLSLYYKNMGVFTEKKSLSELGKMVNITHASALYLIKKANDLRETDEKFDYRYRLIEDSVFKIPKN